MTEWETLKVNDNYKIRKIDNSPYYEIVNSKTNKPLKFSINNRGGYYRVQFSNHRSSTLHRLVAIQYIPNPENKETVNHINGDKLDNRIENLEWVTREENTKHAFSSGLMDSITGKNSKQFKGYIAMYKDLELINVFEGKKEIKKYGLSFSGVYECLNGKLKTHKGYTFKRIREIPENFKYLPPK